MNQSWKTFAWAAALFYAVLLAFIWSALTRRAFLQTESMLDYAMLDLDSTLNGSIDTMLMHVGESIAEELGSAQPLTTERAATLVAQRDIDEVNVFDRTGLNIGSSDPRLPGTRINDNSKSAPFMILTNGIRHAYSQAFRAGAHNPDVRRKYVGVAFPGGDGFIQVGIDESHVTRMFPSIMGFIFDAWLLGETGFFLCADLDDGHLISNPARHRDEARFLVETGYNPEDPAIREDGKTTFRQRLFGDVCDCRAVLFCGHRVIAALPPAEYYGTRTVYAFVMAFVLGLVLLLFVVLFRRIENDSNRLKAFYAAEETVRAKEMEIAKTIQNSALPVGLPASAHFRLFAAMQAAKEVGGDFYDYFPLDDTHIAFLVADVSGKGITGALYMMTAKTLIKDTLLALRDPAAALTKANSELCRNNPVNMFLTAWVGVLDVETGTISFANAGHNPPIKIESAPPAQPNNPTTALPNYLTTKSGPMLAFMDGITYKLRYVVLEPGDTLFLYTDGVTEALDLKNELYGEERLIETLRAIPIAEMEPESVCTIVRATVAAFSAGAPQADDITVMALKYVSHPRVFSRSFDATMEGLAQAAAFLDELLGPTAARSADFAPYHGLLPTLQIFLDEIGSNIVRYSGASDFEIDLELEEEPRGVRMVFIDDGAAYDPLSHADPDTTLSADKRQIGGLGILMVKKMSTEMTYARTNNRNRLTVFKAV